MGGCAEGGRRGENRRIGEERREKGEALGAWWEIARVDEMNLDIILPHLNNFLFGFRYDNRQLPPTYHLPHLSFFLSSSYPTPQSQNTHPPPRQKPIIDHYHTLQTPHPHSHPLIHSLPPPAPSPNPPHDKHERQQNRHLDQRPHGTRQRLPALAPKHRHRHRDRQFEIVARGRERLRRGDRIPAAAPAGQEQGGGEGEEEIDGEGHGDAGDGDDLVDGAGGLRGEEDDDGEEEAEEGERGEVPEEGGVVPGWVDEVAQRGARRERGGQGDAEEDGD